MFARYDGSLRDTHLIFIYNNVGTFSVLNKNGSLARVDSARFSDPDCSCKSRREAIQLLKKYYKTGPGKFLSPQHYQDRYMEFKIFGKRNDKP